MSQHEDYIEQLKAEAQGKVTPRQREIIKLLQEKSTTKTTTRKKKNQ